MKTLLGWRYLAAGFFALAAGTLAAPAETTLYHVGPWKVAQITDSNGAVCYAKNNGAGRSMQLISKAGSPNSVVLSFYPVKDFAGNGYNNYYLQVDPGVLRTFRRAHLVDYLWNYTLPHQDWSVNFLTEISKGKSISMTGFRGRELFVIGLAGSGPAIQSFIQCSASIWAGQ